MTVETIDRPRTKFDSFEIETELAILRHTYENLSYPQDAHSIGVALERLLLVDFSPILRPNKPGFYTSIFRIGDKQFVIFPKVKLGSTEIESGSAKLSSSLLVVLAVSLYQGVATYPDFKNGMTLLSKDLVALIEHLYEVGSDEDEPKKREFSVDLFFREEKDLIDEVTKKIRSQL